MAVLEHQSDSLLPCLLVPSLGHDLSFPQTEVCTKPGVVHLASVRYELVKSFLGLVAIPALGSQLTTVVDGGRGPIRDYEWMDLS